MQTDDIVISVVMPVYNAEKYLGAAIESILNRDKRAGVRIRRFSTTGRAMARFK